MKKKVLALSIGATMSAITLCGCTSTATGTLGSYATDGASYATITSNSDGATFDLLTEPALSFAKNYSIADYKTENVYLTSVSPNAEYPCITNADSLAYCDGTEKAAPAPVLLQWDSKTDALYYSVKISLNADMSNPQSYSTDKEYLSVEDLFMGKKYYYQIYAHHADKTVKSRIFTFKTSYLPRVVSVPGVSNVRDWGGYYTEDGTKRIKQGIVYRGAKVETASQLGALAYEKSKNKMLYHYGIHTDLDLRVPGSEVQDSPFGDAVNFVNVSGPHYVEWQGIAFYSEAYAPEEAAMYRANLATEIRTFVNPDNFPIYVHCSLGRDRTGTICFLINALCGVSKQDLFLDYEISYLSQWGSTGWNESNTPPIKVYQFEAMYQFLNQGSCYNFSKQTITNSTDLSGTTTMADRVAAYMKHYLGITDAEIAAIRANMLEEA